MISMNELQIFENAEFGKVRTVAIDGVPWLVGKDVAEKLGYTNTRKAISDHVDEEDKGVTKCDTLGGKQYLTIINESGFYSLVIGSKPNSLKHKNRWCYLPVAYQRARQKYLSENLPR